LRDNLYDIDNIYKTCNYKPKRLENDRSHNEIFFNGNFIRNEICKEHQYSILVSKMNEMRLLKLGTKGNIIMQSSSTDGSSRCRGIVVFKDRVCEFSYKHTSSDI